MVGASILLWPTQSDILRARPWESVLTLAAAGVCSFVAFRFQFPPAIPILPVLAWAALRLSMLGTALAGVIVAFLGNLMTASNYGLFAAMNVSSPARLAVTQVVVAVMVLVALIIASEVTKRTSAVKERDVEREERLRLESISQLAQQLSAALTPHDVARALDHRLVGEIGATFVALGSLNPSGETVEWAATAGGRPSVSDAFAHRVALRGYDIATDAAQAERPVLIRTESDYERRYGTMPDWMRTTGVTSLAGWPLFAGDSRVGVLLLAWAETQPFDPEQLAYLSAVAAMVGQALTRAQTYADEHARAVVLHSALHPSGPVEAVGVSYDVLYEPADIVHGLGGDWYDVMPLPGERTYFAVGDIVGHGLTAVEDMAQLRSAGRAFANQGLTPAALLAELNGFADRVSRGEFATAVVAVFDHLRRFPGVLLGRAPAAGAAPGRGRGDPARRRQRPRAGADRRCRVPARASGRAPRRRAVDVHRRTGRARRAARLARHRPARPNGGRLAGRGAAGL